MQIESNQKESFLFREHPNIAYSVHPIISKHINEINFKNENLIFNDIMQEAYVTNNSKLKNLTKSFFGNPNTYEKLIQNIIKIYTHEDGIYRNLNLALREDSLNSFLASSIMLLNDAIRSNFLDLRYESKCFRKSDLQQPEFDNYFKIFNSQNKTFCWNSFVSATKTFKLEDNNNNNNNDDPDDYTFDFNALFTIEFSSDSWGLDISKLSLNKSEEEEILLPAMSVFEIVKIEKLDNNIINIGLVKLDKNIKKRISKIESNWVSKGIKIMEQEINLLKNDEMENSSKYCFARDEDNLFKLKFALMGPSNTNYEFGIFQVNIFIPEGYPNKLPMIKFATKIWHPNISFDSGDLYTEILEKIWKPSISFSKLIGLIYNLLITPIVDGEELNTQCIKDYISDRQKFDLTAKDVTIKFADFTKQINELKVNNKISELQARRELLQSNFYESL